MNETCVGGGARRLVDARFLRGLDATEKTELESHLTACAPCTERYRRLQLAERVASVGADRAFEEPSALEIERIAADLHLIEGTEQRSPWWRQAFTGWSAAIAVAAALAVFLVVRPPSETLVERGGGEQRAATFSVFVINGEGAIRPFLAETPVRASEVLKLRASWSGVEPKHVAVAIVDASGAVRVAQLGAPKGTAASATIPGAVALSGSAIGEAALYVVAAEGPIDEAALRAAVVVQGSSADQVRDATHALAVDRRSIQIAEDAAK